MPSRIDSYLDCRGLHSPMPVIEVAKALERMPPGATLRVEADDQTFRSELEGWLTIHQEKLLAFHQNRRSQSALIEKGAPLTR